MDVSIMITIISGLFIGLVAIGIWGLLQKGKLKIKNDRLMVLSRMNQLMSANLKKWLLSFSNASKLSIEGSLSTDEERLAELWIKYPVFYEESEDIYILDKVGLDGVGQKDISSALPEVGDVAHNDRGHVFTPSLPSMVDFLERVESARDGSSP